MKQTWFECKLTYEKEMQNGSEKKVTESYLVDAVNYTEAEARFTQIAVDEISAEFSLVDIKKQAYAEVLGGDGLLPSGHRWYKCKIMYIVQNENTGEEKRQPSLLLIEAKDLGTVIGKVKKHCAYVANDWEIFSVSETALLGLYRHE